MSNHESEEAENTNQARGEGNNNLDEQTLVAMMRRMLRREMQTINRRIDTIQESVNQGVPRINTGRRRQTQPREEEDDDSGYYTRGSQASNPSQRRPRRTGDTTTRNEDNLGSLKLKIPPFHGRSDPDAYLEWEKKIELVFDCQNYSEQRKVQVAATEFYDYAINWWDQIVTTRRRNREPAVSTWRELRNLMRKRFVPSHYHRELHQKLRRLTQGSKSVEDYFQEMESLMIKADVDEDTEATMARFLSGLTRDIQDRLELQTYNSLEEMLHKAVLVEQQVKRRGNPRAAYGAGAATTRPNYSREDRTLDRPRPDQTLDRPRPDPKLPARADDAKGKAVATSSRNRDVRCFKCQGRGHYANECTNKRTMILMDNGEIETEEEELEDESETEGEVELPTTGELLVTRRSLSIQAKDSVQEQRENLFHTRCLVQGKVCSLIIDGGSCTNVASETMVKKLGLEVKKHPRPFKLKWLNDAGEMTVSRQVLVPLTIGKYEDEVLCDVLPMEAGHILLGRPWQFDRRVQHDGFTNRYSFEFNGRKTILAPLAPHEVHQDQLQLQQQGETIVSDPPKHITTKNK